MQLISLGLTAPEKGRKSLDNPAVSLSSSMVGVGCSVASLPVRLLRITPQGRAQEIEDPLYHLLAVAPNPETTSFVYLLSVPKMAAIY